MSSNNPLGFGERLHRYNRREEGKSREEMAAAREQKSVILDILRTHKTLVDKRIADAHKKRQKVFELRSSEDLTNGVLSEMEVATVVRKWVFETYGQELGLEAYDGVNGKVLFRVAE